MHTPSGTAQPDLSSALDDPSDGSADADVVADGAMVRATYPAAHAIDAVSAVLAVGQADGEYTADPALGATTSFVFSYPTRRFYTDPALAGSAAIAPFSNLFAGNRRGAVSERLPYTSYAPDGASPLINCGVDLCANRLQSPGASVEVLDLGAGAGAMLGSARTMQFDGANASPAAFSASGRMFLTPDLALLYPTGTDDSLPALRFMSAVRKRGRANIISQWMPMHFALYGSPIRSAPFGSTMRPTWPCGASSVPSSSQ